MAVEIVVGHTGSVVRVLDLVLGQALQQGTSPGIGPACPQVDVINPAADYQFESVIAQDVYGYRPTIETIPFRVGVRVGIDNDCTRMGIDDHIFHVYFHLAVSVEVGETVLDSVKRIATSAGAFANLRSPDLIQVAVVCIQVKVVTNIALVEKLSAVVIVNIS